MKKKTVLCALGGVAALCVLMATAQPVKPKCVGVAVVPGGVSQVTVFRAFEDGTVEYTTLNDTGITSVPSGPLPVPAWLRGGK